MWSKMFKSVLIWFISLKIVPNAKKKRIFFYCIYKKSIFPIFNTKFEKFPRVLPIKNWTKFSNFVSFKSWNDLRPGNESSRRVDIECLSWFYLIRSRKKVMWIRKTFFHCILWWKFKKKIFRKFDQKVSKCDQKH